jgi:hypothetical protein
MNLADRRRRFGLVHKIGKTHPWRETLEDSGFAPYNGAGIFVGREAPTRFGVGVSRRLS